MCNLNPLKYSLIQYDEILMSAVQVAAAKWDISLNEFEENDNYNVSNRNTFGRGHSNIAYQFSKWSFFRKAGGLFMMKTNRE